MEQVSKTKSLLDDNTPSRPLPQEYKYAGGVYKQVKRGERAVVYERRDEDLVIHEVFTIKVRAAGVIKGVEIPKREVVPGDNDFGLWAWCYSNSEDAAMKKFARLEAGQVDEVEPDEPVAEEEEDATEEEPDDKEE